jgi:hypothetical protein
MNATIQIKRPKTSTPGGSLDRLVRTPGRTYVMFREGDPWHACHVTILAHTRAYNINGVEYFDCYLPKRWRKIATAKQAELRPVRRSEPW